MLRKVITKPLDLVLSGTSAGGLRAQKNHNQQRRLRTGKTDDKINDAVSTNLLLQVNMAKYVDSRIINHEEHEGHEVGFVGYLFK